MAILYLSDYHFWYYEMVNLGNGQATVNAFSDMTYKDYETATFNPYRKMVY